MRLTTIACLLVDVDEGPSLEWAVQDQLGLKLEAKRAPVSMLVVDHLEKSPVQN